MKYKRQGDIYLIPVSETQGKPILHTGSFVLAEGEHSGSQHILTVDNPSDMEISVDEFGKMFLNLMGEGTLTHTHDHLPVVLPPGKYVINHEREVVDHFGGLIRGGKD